MKVHFLKSVSSRVQLLTLSRITCVALFCLALTGCPPRTPPAPPPPPVPQDVEHTVSFPGETLGAIAAWYTGSVENWRKIAQYNEGLEVNKIRIGDTILIPEALVKQRSAMPSRTGAKTAVNKAAVNKATVSKATGGSQSAGSKATVAAQGESSQKSPGVEPASSTGRASIDVTPEATVAADQASSAGVSPSEGSLTATRPVGTLDSGPTRDQISEIGADQVEPDRVDPEKPTTVIPSTIKAPPSARPTQGTPQQRPEEVDPETGEVFRPSAPSVPVIKSRDELLEELLN